MSESDVQAGPTSSPPPPTAAPSPELIVLEALQVAYANTGAEQYLKVYEQLRARIGQRHANGNGIGLTPHPAAPPASTAPALPAAAAQASPAEPMRIRVICATRADREGFFASTALGKSLTLHRPPGVEVRLFPRNEQGLSAVYNTAIAEAAREPAVLLFIHDDVHLCDFHWPERLREALGTFDVVGLAGNRRRVARQPGWGITDEKFTKDKRVNLSGTVAHGPGFPPSSIDVFGPSRQKVVLLDGLFIAVRSDALQAKSLRFDERFEFHFYDLDFCRQVERSGLTMGTWPISVVHESPGGFMSDGWRRGYDRYVDKWGD
ncbi:MAG: glycosyltransferase [Steroidobacteraceae bacterium]